MNSASIGSEATPEEQASSGALAGEGIPRIACGQLDQAAAAERAPFRIRWWVLPLAALLCAAQAILNLLFETHGDIYLIATQISVIAFVFLFLISLVVNPLLKFTRLVNPLSRAEIMTLFAALFVSGGISSFGLADQLVPLIPAPFYDQWNTPQSGWSADILPHLNRRLYITDPNVITQFRQGFSEHASLWRQVPWMAWAKPLAFWLIFVFAMYALFYCLSLLFYSSWAHREKLIFPLARLPEDAISQEGHAPGSIPITLRQGLFWIGFLLVFLLLSYNGACQAGFIRGLHPLRLGIGQDELQAMLSNSIFRGIAAEGRWYLMFMVIFTAVGIGFLLPLEVSFSLWGYYLIVLAMEMVAIWMAVTSSVLTISSNPIIDSSFISSLGGGALLAFSAIQLGKLIHERIRLVAQPSPPCVWGRIGRAIGGSGAGLLAALIILLGWFWWNGIGLFWSSLFLGIAILMAIGLMRVVAEAGVYWFQIHTGPSHLANLMSAGAVPASVLAPLLPISSIFFFDGKTFIAPAMLNSFRMQEEARPAKRMFHAVVVAGIVITTVVSIVTLLYLVYSIGANRASGWFFTRGPRYLISSTQNLISGGTQGAAGLNGLFCLLGAGWLIFSVVLRRKFFWWIHPIGLIMLVSPLMTQLSFSFFIGWLCKKVSVKYGGKHMFARVRPMFIGLIFGELAACFLWAVLRRWLQLEHVQIDINRYRP